MLRAYLRLVGWGGGVGGLGGAAGSECCGHIGMTQTLPCMRVLYYFLRRKGCNVWILPPTTTTCKAVTRTCRYIQASSPAWIVTPHTPLVTCICRYIQATSPALTEVRLLSKANLVGGRKGRGRGRGRERGRGSRRTERGGEGAEIRLLSPSKANLVGG